MKDTHMAEESLLSRENTSGTVFIRVAVSELKVQKCLQFQLEDTVWQAKQRVLAAFSKDLRDPMNYGLYLPPANGRAGKFMEEQRTLSEYPIQGPIGFLEFKYKRRVYKMMQINERKLKQMHTKAKLKLFLEVVRAGNCDKINKMCIKGLDPNFHDLDNGETPLTVAVTLGKSKCREVLIALISGGAHLDYRNRQGLTALHRAAIVGNAEAIRTLLDLGASPDSKDAHDLSPLYFSVSNDDAVQECTHLLLHERARVGICDEHGWYEIHQACKYGRVQHLEHLLFYGAEMDVRNSSGNTPLHVCALNNQEACARVLLFRGADPTLLNYSNHTADQAATMASNPAIADMINNHNPDDVVPFREIPQYSERRKGGSLTPSLRALMRSRSDPRINMSGLEGRGMSPSTSSPSYSALSRGKNGGGEYGDSDSACSVSVSSSGSVTGVTDQGMYEVRTPAGHDGYFPPGLLSQFQVRKAGSLGDVNVVSRATTQRNTLATLVQVERALQPRVVLLHRSVEGYGFVLRGAKSKIPTGGSFNDFTPTAEYPALQYLDSVDPASQADRAGLKAGDFILEINGEQVVRASHEHVVHLIRSSSDVLTLKVVTVHPTDRTPSDWTHQDSGAMTLPNRKKQAAPLPPQRDPRTSLSYSKGSSRSMAEGLAEIEKLDATIAEFEGQEAVRRHSLHGFNSLDDPKVASVRPSHTVKRVSVVDYKGLDVNETIVNGPIPKDSRTPKEYMSPAEQRIKKYGPKKSSSQTMKRSESTPDMIELQNTPGRDPYGIETGNGLGGKMSGSWNKTKDPLPTSQASKYAGALRSSPISDSSRIMGAVEGGAYSHRVGSVPTTPELPNRHPTTHQYKTSEAPSTPEVVRIHTRNKNSTYANVSAEIQNSMKPEGSFGSSFRPDINTKLTDNPKGGAPPDQTILKNTKDGSRAPHKDDFSNVSFADDRVMENAGKFVKKYPNTTLLVTADIHSDKPVKEEKSGNGDEALYEPEPDYDDADEDLDSRRLASIAMSKVTTDAVQEAMAANPRANIDNRPNNASVTVISINSSNNIPTSTGSEIKYGNSKSQSTVSQTMSHNFTSVHENSTPTTSPGLRSSSPRRSSGVAMTSPSQTSSMEPSHRSSGQLDLNTDKVDSGRKFGIRVPTAMTTAVLSRGLISNEGDEDLHTSAHSNVPPPPPPPPPPAPPAPPFPSSKANSPSVSASSTLSRRHPNPNATAALPSRVSTEDILAAVAERKARLDCDAPRFSDVKTTVSTSNINKSVHELNQEALREAVAKRKSRMELDDTDNSVVSGIEARLQKNKKLQAAKFFGSDTKRYSNSVEKEGIKTSPKVPVQPKPDPQLVKTAVKENIQKEALKSKEIAARFETTKTSPVQSKTTPNPSTKSAVYSEKPTSETKPTTTTLASTSTVVPTVDFKARLRHVDGKASTSPIAVLSKSTTELSKPTSVPQSQFEKVSTTVSAKSKAPAPPPPSTSKVTNSSSPVITAAPTTVKPKASLAPLVTSKTMQSTGHTIPSSPKMVSPESPRNPNSDEIPISQSADYIALAEKARQEYLKKKASGNLTPHVEKRGPVEITPNKKNSPRSKPTTPTSPTKSPVIGTSLAPAKTAETDVQVSIRDRIKNFQSDKKQQNGDTNMAVTGVTEDHSHTEQALSNGTIKKGKTNGTISPPPNLVTLPSDGHESGSGVPPPPPGFEDMEASEAGARGVVIDIIPPPSSFGNTDQSPDISARIPAFGQEDNASFVSSVSSLSTLSSEQGDHHHEKTNMSIEDLIAPPPPPPPNFEDTNLGDQNAVIPPPPQFLEMDSNANISKAVDKNSKAFATKPVSSWSCMDVLEWLDSLGLPQYRISFAKACVDGSKLVDMGRNEFINLGVTQVGHRMNLERSVKKLSLASSTNL